MTTYPITLSLELAHSTGSIAMMNDNGDVECRNVNIGKREEDDIFPSMEKLSRALSITPLHMELVVVSSGPGDCYLILDITEPVYVRHPHRWFPVKGIRKNDK